MQTTRYFEEQVLRKRPYIRREWCEQAIASPLHVQIQVDGRLRLWWKVEDLSQDRARYIRVVTLADGKTVHNAFLDRDFCEGGQ